jgi:hypothetical protein
MKTLIWDFAEGAVPAIDVMFWIPPFTLFHTSYLLDNFAAKFAVSRRQRENRRKVISIFPVNQGLV